MICLDEDNRTANVLLTDVYFKDAKGVTKCISVKHNISFITGYITRYK
jgi:hypothetical protein